MKTSRVHHCFAQELCEPRPATCRCRKLITLADATEMIKAGTAQWIVVKRLNTGATTKHICEICQGVQPAVKSCLNCLTSGIVIEPVFHTVFHPTDVVVTSVASIGVKKGSEVFRYAHSKQVPRGATIEKAHIERSYVTGDKEEAERIEVYGALTRETWLKLIVSVAHDWIDPTAGELIFAFGAEQRTPGSYDVTVRERAI